MIKNILALKTTLLGLLFIGLGVWKVFFTDVKNDYEWAYYIAIIGGVMLILSPDKVANLIEDWGKDKIKKYF